MLRLALASSWAGGRAARRRALLSAAVAALVAAVALVGTSATLAAARVADRAEARSPAAALAGSPAQLELTATFDEAPDGAQVYVYWWRFLEPSARIPGIPGQPPPGSWFVSPALFARLEHDPALAARFPRAQVVDDEGVGNPEELVAHRIAPPGVGLADRVTFASNDSWLGLTSDLSWPQVAGLALVLVAIPGAGLLLAVGAIEHDGLRRRRDLLRALGGGPATWRWLIVAETVSTTLPGVLVAAVGWGVLAHDLDRVPLVGRAVLVGDLALTPPAALLACAGVLALVACLAVARAGRGATSTRPTGPRADQVSRVRMLPLALGVGLMVGGALVGRGVDGSRLFVAGVLLTSLAVTWAMPVLLDLLGRALASIGALVGLLAGRRLSYAAVTSSRSLVGFAAVLVLLPVLGAWHAVVSRVDPPNRTPTQAVELRGVLTEPLAAALQQQEEAVVRIDVYADPASGREVLVGDCVALGTLVPLETCTTAGFSSGEAARRSLGFHAEFPGVSQPPPGAFPAGHLFVSDDWRATDGVLRAIVAGSENPTAVVSAPARGQRFASPIVRWVLAAATAAGVLAGLSLLFLVASQAARTASTRQRMGALGASASRIRRLAAVEGSLLVATVGVAALAVGTLASRLFLQVDQAAELPLAVILALAGVVLLATGTAGAGALLTAGLGPRRRGR